MRQAFDPVTLEVLWNRLTTVADEMTTTLIRTAFSTVVNESHDCACILLDHRGQSLAQSTTALPAFMGTMPTTVKTVLSQFAGDLDDGDVIITNDPWVSGGHLPDLTVVRPVFRDGTLIAFAASTAHLPDIGGRVWSADCSEVFEEGLRLPPVKLLSRGRADPLLLRLLRANVRVPDEVEHDIMAQVTATAMGARRLDEIMRHYRLDDLAGLADEILGRSERAMRAAIAAVPDGDYAHTTYSDGFDQEIAIAATVRVRGDGLEVDFTGSSPQQPWGINSALNYTRAYTTYTLKSVLAPDLPGNEGALRPLHVTAPEGCVLNARQPAAVGGRHLTVMFVPFAILGALAKAIPERVMAESGAPGSPYFVLHAGAGGRPTATQFFSTNGGLGARWGKDGIGACSYPPNISNVPVEVVEQRSGLFVERKTLDRDSGGAGRWRGGPGQSYVIHVPAGLDGYASVSILSDRTTHPALGLLGGGSGAPRRNIRNGDEELHPKRRARLDPGDTLEVRMPGGGGLGLAAERDRDAVRRDVLNGYVSPDAARSLYGYEGALSADPFDRPMPDLARGRV